MQNLFLASYFTEVATLFPVAMNYNCEGKTVAFIPTASIPEEVTFYVDTDRDALRQLGFVVEELDIASATNETIEATLKRCDCIFVGGGNTFFLLQEMKRTGCDKWICDLITSGKMYIGSSAGMIVLAPDIQYIQLMDNQAAAPELSEFAGLNMIDFYPLPHYSEYPFEESTKEIERQYDGQLKLYKINNQQVIVVTKGKTEVKTV